MIRTLRTRIVLTYVGVVTFSVIVAFIIYNAALSGPEQRRYGEDALVSLDTLIELYDGLKPADKDAFLGGISKLHNVNLRLYEESGTFLEYGDTGKGAPVTISRDEIAYIMSGKKLVKAAEGIPCNCEQVTGSLLNIEGRPYALIMIPMVEEGDYAVVIILGIILILGSGLFLLVSRYLVRPILNVTSAARQMSKGNLQIRLSDTRRRDEMGDLSRAFNQMAHQLEQLDQMRQQFVSNVSHELQSPLTSIKGFASMLRSGSLSEAERDRALHIIHEESERLSTLSNHLLILATLDAGHCPIDPQPVPVDEQLRRSLLLLESLWSSKEIEVECSLPALFVEGNRTLLEQVWINLLGNAIKYTPEKGKIEIKGISEAEGVTISITDNGIGMGSKAIERIFERFYKADDSRNRNVEGNGLGLSIVRLIVQLHHGSVEVVSQPNRGSTFTVYLPNRQHKQRFLSPC